MQIKLTDHAHTRLVGRNIDLGLVKQVINSPDWRRPQDGGTIKAHKDFTDGRVMEVIYKELTRIKVLVITFYYQEENI